MKLYIVSQNDNNDYDTYDSILVCAESEEDAKSIDPHGNAFKESERYGTWAFSAESLKCEEIGEAGVNQNRGVILTSFNAG
jgi:hypothetical protein